MAREKGKAKPKEEQLAGDAGTLEAEKKSPPPAGSGGEAEAPPAGALNSSDADAVAQVQALLDAGETEIEAASEELGAAPGQWVFPSVEVRAARRSGVEEAQAFFDFSRRLAAELRASGSGAHTARSVSENASIEEPAREEAPGPGPAGPDLEPDGEPAEGSVHQDGPDPLDDGLGDEDVDGHPGT
ncbi:MAG: hypothetical protein LOD85_02885 [Clostridia bacterium]|nr:hypothetical protein [Bacillota bacterium]MBO2521638.1 hypothetical protein [Bacillota bacterium]